MIMLNKSVFSFNSTDTKKTQALQINNSACLYIVVKFPNITKSVTAQVSLKDTDDNVIYTLSNIQKGQVTSSNLIKDVPLFDKQSLEVSLSATPDEAVDITVYLYYYFM